MTVTSFVMRQAAASYPSLVLAPYDGLLAGIGFDAVLAFLIMFGGSTAYIPQPRTVFARCLVHAALAEYTGYNYDSLRRKYGFSERHLRRAFKDICTGPGGTA